MVPPKNYFNGIYNSSISPTEITSLSRHWCSWLKRFIGILVSTCIKCGFDCFFAPKNCLVQTKHKFRVMPFLHGLGTFGELSVKLCFLGDDMGFQGQN
jgi:hypothetical protein